MEKSEAYIFVVCRTSKITCWCRAQRNTSQVDPVVSCPM